MDQDFFNLSNEGVTMKKMKILMVMLMFIVLGVFPALSDVSSDEGPTVIIVGSEQNKQEPVPEQQPENSDQNPALENNNGEETPEAIGNDSENPDSQHLEEYEQDIEESNKE
jgi:ectoine hydroxylase-related dioxygenase (phytanoyl-CoA dioxygenase family)